MILAAGVELAKVGQSVGQVRGVWEQADSDNDNSRSDDDARRDQEEVAKDEWMVMLVTVAGCLAFRNDAVGFIAGEVWHWGLRVRQLVERARSSRRVRLPLDRRRGSEEGLMNL